MARATTNDLHRGMLLETAKIWRNLAEASKAKERSAVAKLDSAPEASARPPGVG